MERLQNLLKEIATISTDIEVNYPELYQFLDENPMTIPVDGKPQMEKELLKEYLESLRQLLAHHRATHSLSKQN